MGRKLRCVLIFLLIILKEQNMSEGCRCEPSSTCRCSKQGLTSIPQNLPTSITTLELELSGIVLIGSVILTMWYKGTPSKVFSSNTNTAVSVMASGDDNQYEDIDNHHNQTGSGQSLATQSLKVGNLSHKKVVASLKPSPMYAGVGTPQKAPTCTSDHNQTGQGQPLATQSLKVGNLSHKEVIAALKPNPMYAGVGTPQKDPTCTSDHNQTGQGQSQAIQSTTSNTTATVKVSGHDCHLTEILKKK
ncbi:PREDICTED: uncharacterized protein LOC109476322 [Branchiostoma belcheri]|uniref:Uncharacterized protein LOC109476322 n=1 Tax=Branchiostoma belcheri TaxID=7741 RepID=A0A6P4Z804_BRABE|nr:PREDICTED: uncharacterized protein LOC109476322 [Branchiostoma belcheri]